VALAAGLLLLIPAPAGAARRYASPDGKTTGRCLSITSSATTGPCTLRRAVETVADPGDEVVVLPGTYELGGEELRREGKLNIHGADGQPRPLIKQSTPDRSGVFWTDDAAGSALRHLQIEAPAGALVLSGASSPAVAEDLVVVGEGLGVSISLGWTLRDTVVRAGGNGIASFIGTGQLRNVTVISTGPNGRGLSVDCNDGPAALVARNVIARGDEFDLFSTGCSTGGGIDIGFSNYRADKTSGLVTDAGNNQTDVNPLFVHSAAAGGFEQAAGSPTIDAGTSDPLLGSFDLDGDARSLGAAPDIGADEFVPPDSGGGGGGGGGPGGEDGAGGGSAGGVVPDTTLPVETNLRIKPKKVRPAAGPLSIAASKGAKVSYTLSEVGQVTFTVERARTGRKVGGKCVKQKRSNRRRRPCVRFVRLKGSFDHAAVEGANSFRFTGRLNGKALKRGGYRLVGTPLDLAGNTGRAAKAKFRVVR
jgi:hypothetical protein